MRSKHCIERLRSRERRVASKPLDFPLDRPVFFQDRLILRIRNQTDPVADGRKGAGLHCPAGVKAGIPSARS